MNHYPKRASQPYDEEDDETLFDDLLSVASSTECTGLIPSTADSDAELDSYSDIYDIPLSKNKKPLSKKSVTPDTSNISSGKDLYPNEKHTP